MKLSLLRIDLPLIDDSSQFLISKHSENDDQGKRLSPEDEKVLVEYLNFTSSLDYGKWKDVALNLAAEMAQKGKQKIKWKELAASVDEI